MLIDVFCYLWADRAKLAVFFPVSRHHFTLNCVTADSSFDATVQIDNVLAYNLNE